MGVRSDEARTSHTQTLEMGRGPWAGTGLESSRLDDQTFGIFVGTRCRCWREDNTSACEHALRVHAICARVSECSRMQYTIAVGDAPTPLWCSAGWLD